ncbi:hypothetical protein GCM10027346_19200 [Hymenobacter seoulensis]
MLHTYLAAPFSSRTRQQQFEAVTAALRAETGAPDTLLLGNISPSTGPAIQPVDAVVLRPRSITLLQLLPGGGELHIPELRTGTWLLDGAPLELPDNALNPYARFEQQRTALAAWLAPHLPPEAANLQFITGLTLFSAPVRFSSSVEAQMAAVPAAATFHLLPDPTRFTRRLTQLATPEIDLTAADYHHLAHSLNLPLADLPPLPSASEETTRTNPDAGAALRQKAGKLWRWLGAEDIDEVDRRTSGYEVDLEARSQEKQELEHLRTSLQADISQQLRAMQARETEREQRIANLQQQLAAAPVAPDAPHLQAQLAAEKQEKMALENSIQAYRAELANRNQELGSKIQQLENLIQRLSSAPPIPALGSTAIPPAVTTPSATSGTSPASTPATEKTSAPASAKQVQFGRPAEARQQLLAGLERLRPALRHAGARLGSFASRIRSQPRNATYLAGAGVVAVLAVVGVSRCGSHDVPLAFQQNGQYGLLASDGDTLAEARYTSIGEFREHRAVAERDGVFGFLDDEGEEVIAPAYDALFPFSGPYARARVGRLYTFLDEKGEEFGAFYYAARDFAEGYAAVLDYRGWHYITGPEESAAAPVVFQEAYSFDQELARVKTDGYFTFIRPEYLADTTEGIAPFSRYTSATDFDAQGRAQVVQQGRRFYIGRDGQEITE